MNRHLLAEACGMRAIDPMSSTDHGLDDTVLDGSRSNCKSALNVRTYQSLVAHQYDELRVGNIRGGL